MDIRLQKYVDAVINIGVGIQPGQKLIIHCEVDVAYFARMAMEAAYRAGAAEVMISWTDEISDRIDYLLAPDEKFGQVAPWVQARIDHLVGEKFHRLSIYADDPESLKGVDPERINRDYAALSQISSERSKQIAASEVQWCVMAVPSPAWARMVFPGASSDEEAVALMWDAIYAACRIDDGCAVENWRKHSDNLQAKVDAMNAHNFKSLRFTSGAGTDLEMDLPNNHLWMGGDEISKEGVRFVPNMPTEEVFTAPRRDGVNGVVYATKPLVYMGDVIDGFWLKFKGGKVVEYAAEKNQHLLEKLLTTSKNADFLGEVALVPYSSPISQSGILWYNTLYDENASCHLALGSAYPDCVNGAAGKSEEEQIKLGLNVSDEHEDFMIGSDDMDIVGITQDGKEVQIFKQGEWALQ
ncbi:MAG: aminopeptidase [Defluviitaleaceae bacterium]|nr:aminopeptidase [Defluviitaleaceae bacterium]